MRFKIWPVSFCAGMWLLFKLAPLPEFEPPPPRPEPPVEMIVCYGCAKERLARFMQQPFPDIKIHIASIDCGNGFEEINYPALTVWKFDRPFTRSSVRNFLLSKVEPDSIVLAIDIDIELRKGWLNTISKVPRGKYYFPIIYSEFSPRSRFLIQAQQQRFLGSIDSNDGRFRPTGYGMVAFHKADAHEWDERYTHWGGEDNAFFKQTKHQIIRHNDRNFKHLWHAKKCVISTPACIGASADYLGSPMGMSLMIDEARATPPSILIVIPSGYMARRETIMATWAADIEKYPNMKIRYFTGNVEYPPVRFNTKMLGELPLTFDYYLKVDDDTYVNLDRLQSLVFAVPKSRFMFLGNKGDGKSDLKKAKLLRRKMCLGGPGYILNRETLAAVQPKLAGCVASQTESSPLWHSDAIISWCIERATGIGCWDDAVGYYATSVFRNVYSGQPYTFDSVTQHPLKKNMAEYHRNLSAIIRAGLTN